jgi:hypothetical protein
VEVDDFYEGAVAEEVFGSAGGGVGGGGGGGGHDVMWRLAAVVVAVADLRKLPVLSLIQII